MSFENPGKSNPVTQTIARAVSSSRGWNHESFPTPPTKPILTPVPDGATCVRYANGFKDALLKWILQEEQFVERGLMTRADFLHIESILIMLVNEVRNYHEAAGLYARDIDWKEVLHPLNQLFQFWKNKWKLYNFPPSPYDYPLP